MKIDDVSKLLALIEKAEIPDPAKKATLLNPESFLSFISSAKGKRIVIDDFSVLEPWAITVLASLGCQQENKEYFIENNITTPAAKFAHSLGLDEVINGAIVQPAIQKHRTFKLCKVKRYEDIEPVSENISKLILTDYSQEKEDPFFEPEEVRKTLRYVMIELLRNVIQHSYDKNGAIIVAQRMRTDDKDSESFTQIAVIDQGIGIYNSLRETRKDIQTSEMALERSIWPHYSGKFYEGQGGSSQNAGMGLFFVSEMAKLTAGKFLIASHGASLYLKGNPDTGINEIRSSTTGFEGTLVAFEMPKRGVADYDELIKTISGKARERKASDESKRWVRFDIPKEKVQEFFISVASENTVMAEEFSKTQLIPRITNGEILCLNFTNMQVCTQSFMHSLLYEALRLAYEKKVPLYVKNVSPSVADTIRLVERYGL